MMVDIRMIKCSKHSIHKGRRIRLDLLDEQTHKPWIMSIDGTEIGRYGSLKVANMNAKAIIDKEDA